MLDPQKRAATNLWLVLRILTSMVAVAVSAVYPLGTFEIQNSVWQTKDLSVWFYRVMVSPWMRWDADWFVRILTHGFAANDGTTTFHPLFLWISLGFFRLGVDPGLSLLIVSSLAALLLFYAFLHLAELDLDSPGEAIIALCFMATFPVSFILFAPYTEALFLLWSALVFYGMRQGKWEIVAIFSFLATLTRQQGIFLAAPLAWWCWELGGHSLNGLKNQAWKIGLTILSAPAALFLWTAYRIGYLKEGGLDFSSLHGLVYSALLSPSSHLVVPIQGIIWPWQAVWLGISQFIQAPDIDMLVNLTLGAVFVLFLMIAWPRLNIADRIYALVITLISFSLYTGPIHAYMGLPRHLMVVLPVFIGLTDCVKKSWQRKMIIGAQAVGMILLVVAYAMKLWIP